jgi:hypothetical protein
MAKSSFGSLFSFSPLSFFSEGVDVLARQWMLSGEALRRLSKVEAWWELQIWRDLLQ